MSTPFYDLASLVVLPSGYKNQKIYAQKPLTTDGQLTFTRASNATRVASNGLIEKVRTNLLLQSNGFNTASWTKLGQGTGLAPVVTANAGTAPDGTNNAFRVQFNCVGSTSSDRSILNQPLTTTNSTPHASSFYVKAFSAGEVGKQLRFVTEQSGNQLIVTLTADWQRVVNVGTSSSTTVNFLIETRGSVTANTSADVLLAFTQYETGDIATNYIATTSAAVSVGPVSGLPRLDYLNSTCPRLLLEPQRTNVVPYSEQLSQWSLTNATLTSNDAISPDGYQNADKIVTTQAGCDVKYVNVSVSASTTYTASFWVKLTSGSGLQGRFYDNTNSTNIEYYTYDSQLTIGEWSKVTRTFTTPAGCTNIQVWYLASSTTSSVTAHFWGFQLEAGAYATSYIPTLGTSVTRVADAASKTGISSLIGQTEGTVFAEFEVTHEMTGNNILFSVSDGTTAQNIYANLFLSSGVNRIEYVVNNGGVSQMSSNVVISNGRHKIALAYKLNDFSVFIDGTQVHTDTSGTVPATSRLGIGTWTSNSLNYSDRISQALVFKTRLTNAQLAELTTL